MVRERDLSRQKIAILSAIIEDRLIDLFFLISLFFVFYGLVSFPLPFSFLPFKRAVFNSFPFFSQRGRAHIRWAELRVGRFHQRMRSASAEENEERKKKNGINISIASLSSVVQ